MPYDIRPLEHLWDMVEQEVQITDVQPTICSNYVLLCQKVLQSRRKVFSTLLNVCH